MVLPCVLVHGITHSRSGLKKVERESGNNTLTHSVLLKFTRCPYTRRLAVTTMTTATIIIITIKFETLLSEHAQSTQYLSQRPSKSTFNNHSKSSFPLSKLFMTTIARTTVRHSIDQNNCCTYIKSKQINDNYEKDEIIIRFTKCWCRRATYQAYFC